MFHFLCVCTLCTILILINKYWHQKLLRLVLRPTLRITLFDTLLHVQHAVPL